MRRKSNVSKETVELIGTAIVLLFLIVKGIINLICTETGEATNYTAAEALAVIEEAQEIDIYKNYRTLFKRDYSIVVDGKRVATVEGLYFRLAGEELTMYSSNGEVMASEKQEILHLNRQAQFKDADGNKIGRLHSKYFDILRKDTYYNNNDEAVARCDEKLTILTPDKYTIHDGDGNSFYELQKKWWFDNYTLTEVDDSELDETEAILISCIEDAVSGGKKKKTSSSSSSKK